MGTEAQVDLSGLETKSLDELIAIEDQLAAADANGSTATATPETTKRAEPSAGPGGDDTTGAAAADQAGKTAEEAKATPDKSPEAVAGADAAASAAAAAGTDQQNAEEIEVKQHVSPPSKWAAERRAKREAEEQARVNAEKAAKAEELQRENEALKQKMDWLNTAIKSKGIDLPEGPADVFSQEKIAAVREEFGDEVADMLQATATILAKGGTAAGGKEPAKTTAQAEQPKPKPEDQPASQVDQDLLDAIDDNDDLAYWRENSPVLWSRAVAKDSALLSDPGYAGLSYKERFAKVVEEVKTEVMGTAKGKIPDQGASGLPPDGFAAGGSASTTISDPLERILAAQNPTEQLRIYNSLSEAQRDEVDKSLNI